MESNTTRGAKTLNPLRILQPLIPCPPRLKAAHGTRQVPVSGRAVNSRYA